MNKKARYEHECEKCGKLFYNYDSDSCICGGNLVMVQ